MESRLPPSVWAWFVALLLLSPAARGVQTLGDIDQDGVATVRDIAVIAGHFSGTATLSEIQRQYADVNKDGVINDADMDELVKEILGTRNPETLPLASIRSVSPASGEGDVAVTRETVVHFTIPLAAGAVLDSNKFKAEFGGKKILSRVDISSDRKKATLFYLEPLPPSARVRVTLDPTGLVDMLGRPIDANGDGIAGGVFASSFDTLAITPVPQTAVYGRVLASERALGGGDQPLAGVTVTVDGAEQTLRAVTNANGDFVLSPAPAGSFFVHIDGRTAPASSYPGGNYYPVVGKKWHAHAGRTDNPAGDIDDTPAGGGTGVIYLPLIKAGTMRATSQVEETLVTAPASVVEATPAMAGVEIQVPPNSLFSDDGTRGGSIGIAPVAPDRIPSPLPPGLNLPLVITVQTNGASNFDRPVGVTFPNTPDPASGFPLAPGAKSALWSFNHDIGEWEVVGPMTVSDDGLFVKSDPGVGILQPGWHGTFPGCQPGVNPLIPDPVPAAPGTPPPVVPPPPPGCDHMANALGALEAASAGVALVAGVAAVAVSSTAAAPVLAAVAAGAGAYSAVVGYGSTAYEIGVAIGSSENTEAAKIAHEEALKKHGEFMVEKAVGEAKLQDALADNLADGEKAFQSIKNAERLGSLVKGVSGVLDILDIAATWQELSRCYPAVFGGSAARPSGRSPRIPKDNPDLRAACGKALDAFNLLLPPDFADHFPEGRKIFLGYDTGRRALLAFEADGRPYISPTTGKQLVLPSRALFRNDLSQKPEIRAAAIAGFNAAGAALQSVAPQVRDDVIELVSTWTLMRDQARILFRAGEKSGRPLPGGYYRLANTITGETISRGPISEGGYVSLFAATDLLLTLEFTDVSGQYHGMIVFHSPREAGGRPDLGSIVLLGDGSEDGDGDGLGELAERVIGTDKDSADSDNDGITDGAELQQGSNPLDGKPVSVGVIATAPTAGPAMDIATANGVAAVAMGSQGVTFLGIGGTGATPVRLTTAPGSGYVRTVAGAGNRIVTADESAGVAIYDVSSEAQVSLLHQISLKEVATSVATDGILAFAGTRAGKLAAIDIESGAILGNLQLPSGEIEDLAFGGDILFVRQQASLTTVRFDEDTFSILDSVALLPANGAGGRKSRLSLGNGLVYATHTQGFQAVNVTDPAAITVANTFSDGQFGWKEIVANGSGLGVAATSPNSTDDGPHDISLYRLGNDGLDDEFVTTVITPGLAAGVHIFNGMAYVADSEAGLQVINYLAFDNQGQPPSIALSSNFDLAVGQAEESKAMRLTAAVTDDVQVRNVEFCVDGERRTVDGSFPFEFRFITPELTAAQTSFTVRARAIDTGGNATWSQEHVIQLVPDATPPRVVRSLPATNGLAGSLKIVSTSFSEPMNSASIANGGLQLISAGPDRQLGTADDVVITSGTFSYREETCAAFLTFAEALEGNFYRLRVTSQAADLAGNPLAIPYQADFRVYDFSDADNDGIPDDIEDLFGFSATNADSNGNGIPDGNEDADGDGLNNASEILFGSDPFNEDSDGDGTLDGDEDFDLDGLKLGQEFTAGTDPLKFDTDGDQFGDGDELLGNSDPRDPKSNPLGGLVGPQGVLTSHLPLQRDLRNSQGDINQTGYSAPFLPTPADINNTGIEMNSGQPTVIIVPSSTP